jgi:hypothetical protein
VDEMVLVSDATAFSEGTVDCSTANVSSLERNRVDSLLDESAILSMMIVKSSAALRQCSCDDCHDDIRLRFNLHVVNMLSYTS